MNFESVALESRASKSAWASGTHRQQANRFQTWSSRQQKSSTIAAMYRRVSRTALRSFGFRKMFHLDDIRQSRLHACLVS